MIADLIIAFCAIGLLVCVIYIIYQAKKLQYEKHFDDYSQKAEQGEKRDVYASIEDDELY